MKIYGKKKKKKPHCSKQAVYKGSDCIIAGQKSKLISLVGETEGPAFCILPLLPVSVLFALL